MKLSRIATNGTLITFLGLFCFYSSAQVQDFSDCRSIEDRDDRYQCYDAIEASQAAPGAEGIEGIEERTGENAQGVQTIQGGNAENLPVVRLPRRVEQPVTQNNNAADQEESNGQVDDFGLEKETTDSRIIEGADGKSELVDTIAEIRRIGQGLLLITLSSGQRWQQTQTKRYFLKEGEEVRIYPSIWGTSYRLTSSRLRGFIQVKRID